MKQKEQLQELFQFIQESPTSFHAAANLEKMLETAGFVRLEEKEIWKLKQPDKENSTDEKHKERKYQGGKYYVNRNDSSLIAFTLPKKTPKGFHIVSSHSDSPCFKLKEIPEMTVNQTYLKWNVEKYGGMILSTWLDRPLSIAGRVMKKGEKGIESHLVNLQKNTVIIPNVAIHMNRDINKGVEYNPQIDMQPLVGMAKEKGKYLELLAKEAHIKAEEILACELFLYNKDACCLAGLEDAFIAGPRLDDLECAFGSMQAFIQEEPKEYVNLCAVFDNEEVGSGTKQGADSTFLKDVLIRISKKLGLEEEGYQCLLADSFCISADNAHALHPNHAEKADNDNYPVLNGGIVIKYHGSQRYATDAYSAAMMKDICKQADVPYQTYANRSDIAGGGTLGNISTAQVSVNTVDIGLAQLAMHSALETAGAKDIDYLVKALRTFYRQ